MIDANELRNGTTFESDGDLYKVVEYSHTKPGRGLATIRVKARNLRSGSLIEKTFSSSARVNDVRLDYHDVQFLYADGDMMHFMDLGTYEQPAIAKTVIEEAVPFLKEGMQVKLTFYEGEPLDIDLPTSIELKVVQAEPSVKGDTATGVNKIVTTETGLEVSVPAFVEVDDVLKVDTRSGEYITRA